MGDKKVSVGIMNGAMVIIFTCAVVFGVGVFLKKGNDVASGGAFARANIIESRYNDLRAQVLGSTTSTAPALLSIGVNKLRTNPLVFSQGSAGQVMGSFTISNNSSDVIYLKKVSLSVPPNSPMTSVRSFIATSTSTSTFSFGISVGNTSTTQSISFPSITSLGFPVDPGKTIVFEVTARPEFSRINNGLPFLTFISAEVLVKPNFSVGGQAITSSSSTSTQQAAIKFERAQDTPSSSVAVGTTDATLMKFVVTPGGEDWNIRFLQVRITAGLDQGLTPVSADISNIRLVDDRGTVIGSSIAVPSGNWGTVGTFSNSYRADFGLPEGNLQYFLPPNQARVISVKADINSQAVIKNISGHLIAAPYANVATVSGSRSVSSPQISGYVLPVTSSTSTSTVVGALTASVNSAFTMPTYFLGGSNSGVKVGSFVLSASAAEDIQISSLVFDKDNTSNIDVVNLRAKVGAVQYGTTTSSVSDNASIELFDRGIIAAGTSITVDLYADILSSTTAGTHDTVFDLRGGVAVGARSGAAIPWPEQVYGQTIIIAPSMVPSASSTLSASINSDFPSPSYSSGNVNNAKRIASFVLSTSSTAGIAVSSLKFDKDFNAQFTIRNMYVEVDKVEFGAVRERILDSEQEISFTSVMGPVLVSASSPAIVHVYADIATSTTAAVHRSVIDLIGGSAQNLSTGSTMPWPAPVNGQDVTITGVSAPAPTLSLTTSVNSPSSRYLVMGSSDNVLYSLNLAASGAEDVRVTDIILRDVIANNATGIASFNNLRLYNDAGTLLAGPVNMTTTGSTGGDIVFSLGSASSLIIPKNSSKMITLKGDVATFVSGGAKSGSSHVFGISSPFNVTAYGKDSSVVASVIGTPSGSAQTVYRTKPILTSSVLGATTGRTRVAVDEIASMVWSANFADDLTISRVSIKLTGQAVTSGTAPFYVSLIDANTNTVWGDSVSQTCTPVAGSQCSVTFNPQFSITRGTNKTVKLRVNSSGFFNNANTNDSLSAVINASSDILWSDGTTNGIGFEPVLMPITLTNVSYE